MRHKPIIVILALCLLLPTAMSAQKVTGNFSSTTLGAVLDEVEARTGYHSSSTATRSTRPFR